MQFKTDTALLNEYAAHRSEAAFGEIVRRYADFVYSAALRQVGNPEPARDVAQTVFITLARKAGSLPENVVLIGWLCHSARLAALDQLRKDHRRLQRERLAMDLLDSTPETADDWNTVRPVLDEAIASLGGEDRNALLLRFFKSESFASVGAALGVSEDAAQKRVSRALGKLREFLTGRGITTTTAALSATLAANAVQAAPAGFAGSLATGALMKTAAASPIPLFKLFTTANMKSVALLTLTGGLIVLTALQINTRKQLREATARADQQAETIAALRAASQPPAEPTAELERLRADARDILRLRGQVAGLQRDLAAAQKPVFKAVESSPQEMPTQPQMNIKAKLICAPTTFGPMDGTLLTEPAAEELIKSLRKTDAIDLAGQGDVTTLSGRQAQLQFTLDSGDTNDPLLFFVDLLAVNETNSSEIKLDFTVTSVSSNAMVNLPPEDMPPDRSLRARSVYQFTNSISLLDGQTLVLSRPIANNEKWMAAFPGADTGEPRNLLILLTPTLIDPAGNRLPPREQPSQTAQSTN